MKVWYMLTDNGDGSTSAPFFESEALARLEEEWKIHSYSMGWGESSISSSEGECDEMQTAQEVFMQKCIDIEDFAYDSPERNNLEEVLLAIAELV